MGDIAGFGVRRVRAWWFLTGAGKIPIVFGELRGAPELPLRPLLDNPKRALSGE